MIEILDTIAQTVIIFTGIGSMALVSSQEAKIRMYAGMIGLAGEPFWLTTAIIAGQWGVILLVIAYGINWWRVFWKNYKAYKLEKNNNV